MLTKILTALAVLVALGSVWVIGTTGLTYWFLWQIGG